MREVKIARTSIMSRQDANAAFALSSFLQGTNATYIDEIYARYEKDPASWDPESQGFFQSLKGTPADRRQNAKGRASAPRRCPLNPPTAPTSAPDSHRPEGQ